MTSRLPGAARTVAPAQLPPAGLPGMRSEFSRLVEAAGRTWHLLDTGPVLEAQGVEPVGTVLCVHGNPTWSYLWRSFAAAATDQALASGTAWRVIAVDQLEMGFSERTGLERDLTRRVADLADLTDALGLDGPVVTFGHDWGGIISLGWAVDHRAQLAGVMVLNTAVNQPSDSEIPAPLRLALGKGVLGRATVTTPAFLETTLALAHPPLPAAVKDAYRAPYVGAWRRGGIGAFVADIPTGPAHRSEAERRRVAEALRELRVPAVALWGPRDPIFSDRYLDDLLTRLPHADVHRYEGAGHLLADDVDFASAALTWLDARVAAAASSPAPAEQGPQELPATAPGTAAPGRPTDPAPTPLLAQLDARAASAEADEVAVVEMAGPTQQPRAMLTWRCLQQRVDRLARGLAGIGVRPGDRVSLLVPPGADLTAVLYACLRLGAVVVVADAGLGARGLTRAVRGARPRWLIGALPGLTAARTFGWPGRRIAVGPLAAPVAAALGVTVTLPDLEQLGAGRPTELPALPSEGDPAAILFTSGSTGPAKGVAYTHGQLAAVCRALSAAYDVTPATGIVAGFAPFALLGPALGARSVTPDMDVTKPATLTADAVAAAAAEIDATVMFLSPAALRNVVATAPGLSAGRRQALDRIRTFLSAGAPVSAALLEAAQELMPAASAHTPYGMTECLLVTDAGLPPRAVDPVAAPEPPCGLPVGDGVCVGLPIAGVTVRIAPLDESGASTGAPTADADVTGEIVIAAPHLFDHYDRLWLTDHAARSVPAEGAPDGADATRPARWHRTGDVGHLDADGRLWVEGRLPHVVTTADGLVTPVAPEQRIERVPAVDRAAIVGTGPAGAQQLVAVVEASPRAPRSTLAREALASVVRTAAEVPLAAVLSVPELPTDVRHNSKIDRAALSVWATGVLSGERLRDPR